MIVDTLIAACLVIGFSPFYLLPTYSASPWRVPVFFGQLAPLAFRRHNPRATLAVVSAFALVQWLADIELSPANTGLMVALFAATAYGSARFSRTALVIGLVGVVMAATRYGPLPDRGRFVLLLFFLTAIVVGTWAFGERRRTQLLYLHELEQRAVRVAREAEQDRALAVAAERARIAREMHDVVAHGLSVMIVSADGGRYAMDVDPEQARQALTTISRTGRESLAEMRSLLGLLRDDRPAVSAVGDDGSAPGGTAPQPDVSGIPALVEQVRASGLAVQLHHVGTPRELPALVGLTAYRVVQESLTNTLKHGGPHAHADITLAYGEDALTVTACDDGLGAAAAGSYPSGHGLVGMRERVALTGGDLTAEPLLGKGFRVVARLPYGLDA